MLKSWDRVLDVAAKQFPKFNDYLIYGYRSEKIDLIPEYIDKMFHQVMEFFGGQATHCGYRALSPEERIDYLINNPITKGCWSIRDTETITMRYESSFQGRPYYIYIDVPYMINEHLTYNDTAYYPMFPIVERSGVNRTENGTVIVKVMRVPVTFGRRQSDKYKITSVSGKVYPELMPSVKIYQGKNSGKKSEHIPIVLYLFAKYGYFKTIKKFGFKVSDISFSQTFDTTDKNYDYFIMPDGKRYLKVSRDVLADGYKLRVVLSIYRIFSEIPEFTEADAFTDDNAYYATVLGKFTSSKDSYLNKLLLPNAMKHLAMTDPMLDLVAKDQLRKINCNCDNIYDLLYWMFYNIDDLLVSYEPTNLFDKKIESLDTLACYVAKSIAYRQYNIINSKKAVLDHETYERFCRQASQRPSWIAAQENERQCQIFVTNPASFNSNWLFQVGLKRCLSLESLSSSFSKKNKKGGGENKTSPNLLKAHASQLVVTSILDIPASSPIKTGSMNPFAQIENDGSIVKPKYADEEIGDVFK